MRGGGREGGREGGEREKPELEATKSTETTCNIGTVAAVM